MVTGTFFRLFHARRRVTSGSRDDRRVTRETVFDYFRRMQYPLPPQYRDRNDDFWR